MTEGSRFLGVNNFVLGRTGRPSTGGTEGWDEGEATSLHWPVSTAQTNAVREHGTYWGTKAKPSVSHPDGFAVSGLSV